MVAWTQYGTDAMSSLLIVALCVLGVLVLVSAALVVSVIRQDRAARKRVQRNIERLKRPPK